FLEAESYPGPSMIIAYSHCIAHGYDLARGVNQQKLAVESGHWPLFRFDPRRLQKGENPLQLDSGSPKIDLASYVRNETRYRMVEQQNPDAFRKLVEEAQKNVHCRHKLYEHVAGFIAPKDE
ncbi:MAG: hypothetical protein ACOCVR_04140, partial [Myxococcota bacterium]